MMDDFQASWIDNKNLFHNSHLIPNSLRMIICGPSNSGKTYLLNKMLLSDNFLDYNRLYIFTPTISQITYQIVIQGFKNNLRKDQIKRIYENQNEITDVLSAIKQVGKEAANPKPIVEVFDYADASKIEEPTSFDKSKKNIFIFDDCCYDKVSIIEKYYSKGRHNNINCIYLTNSFFALPSDSIRNNANQLIFFEDNKSMLRNLWNSISFIGIDDCITFIKLCDELWKEKDNSYLTINREESDLNLKYTEF